MLNLLYCLDQNYNLQTITSIMSFLKNTDESINIYIIHENPESFEEYLQKIKKEEKINKIIIKKFNSKGDVDYPNLFDRHVSIATYFRLHLEEYIEEDIDHLIYVDSDVICISNPVELLYELKNKLINSKFIVCVKTISKRLEGKFHIEEINRLDLINDNYFNAGVMIIDFNKWKNQNVSKKLINILNENKSKITFWDQDVLNIYFDGKFLELNSSLNYEIYLEDGYKKIESDTKLVHYSGSFKPWTVRAITEINSNIYQNNFLKLMNRYHITHTWKRSSLKYFFKSVLNLKIFNIENPLIYIKNFFQSLNSNFSYSEPSREEK